LVTAISAEAGVATSVVTVAVLLARLLSFTPELTESVSVMVVPLTVPEPTCTTSENVDKEFSAFEGRVQVIVPLAPTAGVLQLQAAGEVKDTKVVLEGMDSLNTTLRAG
jgi:hypothetical protein